MALFMTTKQKLTELLKVIANETRGYQLILNFNHESDVLSKTVNSILKSFPTTEIKKVTEPSEVAKTFLMTEKWLSIIINGNDVMPLDLPTLKQKRMLTPFVAMEIHETLSGDSINLFLTRCSEDNQIVRSTYSFIV